MYLGNQCTILAIFESVCSELALEPNRQRYYILLHIMLYMNTLSEVFSMLGCLVQLMPLSVICQSSTTKQQECEGEKSETDCNINIIILSILTDVINYVLSIYIAAFKMCLLAIHTYIYQYFLVTLPSPWQESTFLPQHLLIQMTCTGDSNQNPYWSVHLADREISIWFPSRLLNDHCIYEIDHETTDTIWLLINCTIEGNNGTVVRCVDGNSGNTIAETTLIIHG